MKKSEYLKEREKLSPRAAKLLRRLERGAFYMARRQCPAAMAELVEAGLVGLRSRVVSMAACYVPTWGFTDPRWDQLSEDYPA